MNIYFYNTQPFMTSLIFTCIGNIAKRQHDFKIDNTNMHTYNMRVAYILYFFMYLNTLIIASHIKP